MGDLHLLYYSVLSRYLVILIGTRNSFSNIDKSDPKAPALSFTKESTAWSRNQESTKNGKYGLRWGSRKEKGWPTSVKVALFYVKLQYYGASVAATVSQTVS